MSKTYASFHDQPWLYVLHFREIKIVTCFFPGGALYADRSSLGVSSLRGSGTPEVAVRRLVQ